jgi:hypothetical protein
MFGTGVRGFLVYQLHGAFLEKLVITHLFKSFSSFVKLENSLSY